MIVCIVYCNNKLSFTRYIDARCKVQTMTCKKDWQYNLYEPSLSWITNLATDLGITSKPYDP